MNIKTLKYELQNILSGKSEVSYGESIQAITRYLRESIGTSEKTQTDEQSKSEETKKLIEYINTQQTAHEILYFIDTVFFIKPKTFFCLNNKK